MGNPLGSELSDKVSAVGPDAGGCCRFYLQVASLYSDPGNNTLARAILSDSGCTDDDGCKNLDLMSPGCSDLNQAGTGACAGVNTKDKITTYQYWDW